nr:MAG TPA: hypothetical protein [Bacteriophage sp.]DAJ69694.1 MAG TPA: hypothetical protein [Caudoviricetes sp.]
MLNKRVVRLSADWVLMLNYELHEPFQSLYERSRFVNHGVTHGYIKCFSKALLLAKCKFVPVLSMVL